MDQHVDAFQAAERFDHRKRQVVQIEWIEKGEMEPIFIETSDYARRSISRKTNLDSGPASGVCDPLCSSAAFFFVGIRNMNFREWNAAFSRTLECNKRTAVDRFPGFTNNCSPGAAI